MTDMPQFPLRTVLFPTMLLPLHVFEPRYRTMVHHLLEGDRRFGVVMIERGLDTGGEDHRSDFGTVAQIVEAEEFPDGRWALATVGVERFRVNQWLDDAPYPRADVEVWPDPDPDGVDGEHFASVESKFRRCMALASEMGVDTGPLPDRIEPSCLGTMQLAALLPVGSLDKQRLLGAECGADRLELLERTIDDALELIELELRQA
ncbi:MAG: LON peptidase substrate-binding domain-containing protein [Actinomycetota bacterium]